MYKNCLTHEANPKDLLQVSIRLMDGTKGVITEILGKEDSFDFTVSFDGKHEKVRTHSIEVVVDLEPGHKYMCMNGDIVTIHKNKFGKNFHFHYSEVTGDKDNHAIELIYPGGLSYHSDCGCNILKKVI